VCDAMGKRVKVLDAVGRAMRHCETMLQELRGIFHEVLDGAVLLTSRTDALILNIGLIQ
jgi:hypothetical protein